MSELYDSDFFAWANAQAALLRAGDLSAADIGNIAEEIESMGRSEKRELVNRLTGLLLHLLKWKYQPERRSRSWLLSVAIARREITRHMADNPSLKAKLSDAMSEAYEVAVLQAAVETDLPEANFPAVCEWTFEAAMTTAEPSRDSGS